MRFAGNLFLLLFACHCAVLRAQRFDFRDLKISENSFCIVARGTKTKSGMVVQQFNLEDMCVTHVGLCVLENGCWRIYNVTNDAEDPESALVSESPQEFARSAEVEYLGFWEFQSSAAQITKLIGILKLYATTKIAFDFDFDEKDDKKMYCSEFCVKVLRQLDSFIFDFPLTEKQLDPIYKLATGKSVLRYWPADFFQSDPKFKKIYERFF